MAEVKFVKNIKGLGKLYVCYANFYDQSNLLKEAGIKYLISVRDTAYMRLNNGSRDGTRTCHAPIWCKDAPLILARISPLVENLEMARLAVEANRNNKYFSTNDNKLYEKYAEMVVKDTRKSPGKQRAIVLPEEDNFKIGKNHEVSKFLFRDTAEEYFNKFAPNGITFYAPNREFTQDKNGTGVSYLWFRSLDCDSVLDGNYVNLDIGDGAFGVSRSRGHAEGVAKNFPYSQREVARNLKILNQIMKGEVKISNLESKLGNVVEFLESLKQ